MSDSELLQRYLQEDSQEAFAAVVARYLNLVYSAALRQVRSPQLAEEAAQSVFVDLSRQARQLKPEVPLAAWLYVVTRRASLKILRRESRRQVREHTAYEIAAMNSPSPEWPRVEPLLDEAMESLDADARSAVLLRYFENKSLREVGQALGTSDDTAQKRVSRAVDQLRAFFLKRGVAVTAAGLTTNLSAHAIESAPIALGASISAAVALPQAVTTAATQVVMTTAQKTLLTATLALVVGGACYESSIFARQKSEIIALDRRATRLSAELRRVHEQQLIAADRLAAVKGAIASPPGPTAPAADGANALELEMRAWLANLDELRQLIEKSPQLGLPELQFVSDQTWFSIAASAKLESETGIRQALAKLRHEAENAMAAKLAQALDSYLKANNGILPDQVAQLLPFFQPAIDPGLLNRYEMLRTGRLAEVPELQRMAIVAAKSPVDVEYDDYWNIGRGYGAQNAMRHNLDLARSAFAASHGGQQSSKAAELLPYLKWPVDEAVVEKFLNPPPASAH